MFWVQPRSYEYLLPGPQIGEPDGYIWVLLLESTAGLFVTLPVPVWGSSAFLVGRTPRLIGGFPSSQHQLLSSALTSAV